MNTKLVSIGLRLIGHDILVAARTTDLPRWLSKGKSDGMYESDMDWDYQEK